jgi:hypothetical protein
MISTGGGWLFIHVPKTGGNSIQSILAPFSDDALTSDQYRDGVQDFEVAGPRTARKHMSLQEYHDLLPAEVYARLLKVAVVRDPWERAISAYFGPIRFHDEGRVPEWSVERFCTSLGVLDTMTGLVTVGGVVDLDVVLRFERLADGAAGLFHLLGIDAPALPHRNRGLSATAWHAYYEQHPELVDVVAERFADDIAIFGYAPPR